MRSARSAAVGPMIVSGAAPPMVDALRRVRRCMFRRVFCRFCHARSRVSIVFGPFHYCASCERAAPDAPETIDDQRRSTECRYRTIYGGSRGSASLPAPAKWLGPSTPAVEDDDSSNSASSPSLNENQYSRAEYHIAQFLASWLLDS